MKNFKSFAITIRPPFLTEEDIDRFLNLTRSMCSAHTIITEKEDEQRHIHAQWFTLKETQTFNIWRAIIRKLGEDWEHPKVACKVKVAYNSGWMDTYMNKGDSTRIIEDTVQTEMTEYFPPEIETRKRQAADGFYNRLEELWKEYMGTEVPTEERGGNTDCFLSSMMYDKRKIRVMDPKRARTTYVNLSRYINRHTGTTAFDMNVNDFNC